MIDELQNAKRNIISIASIEKQGAERAIATSPSIIAVILSLLFLTTQANGQAAPKPPDAFCIEGTSCASAVVGTVDSKKWNPGHYIKAQGNHAQADQQKYSSSVMSQIGKLEGEAEIKGALVNYAWGVIEPNLGNYNWAPIYTHLNYLSARGKKMIVGVMIKCFGNDCVNLAPAELASEVFVTDRASPTSIIEVWEEKNMDAFIAFWHAFAAEFDDNPALEMVLGAESTPSLQGSVPASYTKRAYATQLKRMYTAQSASFNSTNVVAMVNWLGGEVSGLLEHAFQASAGRGMPDIFDSAGTIEFRGECHTAKDCGVRDYRGLVPHFGVVSSPTLKGKHDPAIGSPATVIAYGLANNLTHYAWVSNEKDEDSWANIIVAIKAAKPNAHLACPTGYAQGCK